MQTNGLGYKILVLAPFDADPGRIQPRAPLAVRRDTLDDVMATLDIRYTLPLDTHLCPAGGIELLIGSIKALHPDGMVKGNAYLSRLLEAAAFLRQALNAGQAPDRIRAALHRWPDLPEVTLPVAQEKTATQRTTDSVDQILQMVAMPGSPDLSAGSTPNTLEDIPAQIVNTVLHSPDFRQMEAAWRGLRLLLAQGAQSDLVRVELASLHSESLGDRLDGLTAHVLADPPALVLVDLPFDNTPLSIERMGQLAHWAEEIMVPVLAWVPPTLLQIDSWKELAALPYLAHHLDSAAYAKFRALRSTTAARWLCLTCNRFLIRYPYGPDNPARHVAVRETAPLWIPPVWGLATLIAQSVCQTGWPTRFTERDRFQLQDLALAVETHTPPLVLECSPDSERRVQFFKIGISPLSTEPGRDRAFFSDAVTLAGGSLRHQLLVCLVTRFVLWCRENFPDVKAPADLELQLRLAFQVFSERSSPPGLEAVHVEAGAADGDGRLPVRIVVTPSGVVLSGEPPIELQLNW
jgi:type VI secretion system protein ImpC